MDDTASQPAPRLALEYPALVGILGGGQLARMTAEAASTSASRSRCWSRRRAARRVVARREIVGAWRMKRRWWRWRGVARSRSRTSSSTPTRSSGWSRAAAGLSRRLGGAPDPGQARAEAAPGGGGLPVASSGRSTHRTLIRAARRELGWPLVLKARRNGYDGYGNATLRGPEDVGRRGRGWARPARAALVEAWAPFVRELAVMVARGRDGELQTYPVVETLQRNHICLDRARARARRAACGAGGRDRRGRRGDRRHRRLRRRAVRAAPTAPCSQRARAAPPQLRPLHHRGLRHLAVREPPARGADCRSARDLVAPAAVMVNLLGTALRPARPMASRRAGGPRRAPPPLRQAPCGPAARWAT